MEVSITLNVKALKIKMVEKGLEKIVDLSKETGINRNILSLILNGKKQPPTAVIEKLIEILDISTSEAGPIFFNVNLRNA